MCRVDIPLFSNEFDEVILRLDLRRVLLTSLVTGSFHSLALGHVNVLDWIVPYEYLPFRCGGRLPLDHPGKSFVRFWRKQLLRRQR